MWVSADETLLNIIFRECDIDFYYAISPGLDITYSNAKEIACLKRKLDQVGIFTDITSFYLWLI